MQKYCSFVYFTLVWKAIFLKEIKVEFLRFQLIPKFYFFHFSYFIGDHKGDFFNIQSQITLILDKKSGNNLNFVEEIFACPFKPNRICSRSWMWWVVFGEYVLITSDDANTRNISDVGICYVTLIVVAFKKKWCITLTMYFHFWCCCCVKIYLIVSSILSTQKFVDPIR